MGANVEILLNLADYGRDLSDNIAQRVGADVVRRAKRLVAVGETKKLRNSIRLDRVSFAFYEVISDLPYTLAQEYGRPDLEKYTFTPFLRPAAFQAGQPGNIAVITINAHKDALRENKV